MYVLGIATDHVNSAAALLKDGELIACFEEDRLRKVKNRCFFPELAIGECLRFSGITIKDIDIVAVNHDPVKVFCLDSLKYWASPHLARKLFWRTVYYCSFYRRLQKNFEKCFPSCLKLIWPRVKFFEHHLCHAASSYFLSPFEGAAILTADGNGESATVLYAHAQGASLRKIKEIHYPASLGKFYTTITEYLGFTPHAGEGTVMALAAYGDKEYCPRFDKFIKADKNGLLQLDMRYFTFYDQRSKRWSNKFEREFGMPRVAGGKLETRHCQIAAAAQVTLEKNILLMLDWLKKAVGGDNLCLAGGVFLNCSLNSVIRKSGLFKNIYVQPAMNDVGTAFGAGFLWHVQNTGLNTPRKDFVNPYLGREFYADEIEQSLRKHDFNFQYCPDVGKTAAAYLAEGKVVAWFQGRAEMGPRALGNRSLLASPCENSMREHINAHIKHREWFRPFAPAVLAERFHDYFKEPWRSPFMLYTNEFRETKQDEVPACVHKDGTARPQSVERQANPLFYHLISEFDKISGVPMVLNTSFNLRGKPIVDSPDDALAVFKNSPIEVLCVGPYCCHK
ncbi:MAG: carbamoyltransferase C-terminal domain-containing protein [Candidatus Omnitrophota bacterium]